MNVTKSFASVLIWLTCSTTWMAAEKSAVKSKIMHTSPAFPWGRSNEPAAGQNDPGHTRCKSTSDCSKDECCVFRKTKEDKVCRKMLLSEQRCSSHEIPGLNRMCPCTPGLTCSLTAMVHHKTIPVYRCTAIPPSHRDKEFDEEKQSTTALPTLQVNVAAESERSDLNQ